MENFVLWNVTGKDKSKTLSFFATSVHVQRIQHGTSHMIAEMIRDLEINEISLIDFEINHFATNYLCDDPYSTDWRDIWQDTCEIKLYCKKPLDLKNRNIERDRLFRTYAGDDSWDGTTLNVPVSCVIVADFASIQASEKAKNILESINNLKDHDVSLTELKSQLPEVPLDQLRKLKRRTIEANTLSTKTSPLISISSIKEIPCRLIVSLGTFKEEFFLDGARFAEDIQDIVYELDGVTNWNDLNELRMIEELE